jgi:hypothetical protein
VPHKSEAGHVEAPSGDDVEAEQQPPSQSEAGAPKMASQSESAAEEGAQQQQQPKEGGESFRPKSNVSIGQKITSILAMLKQQTAEKKGPRLDETLAEEFERVRLNEGEGEGEVKELKQQEVEKGKESIRDRIRALFGKAKGRPEDVEMAEKRSKAAEDEEVQKEEEEKMEELEPEDKEEKEEEEKKEKEEEVKKEGQSRGSETPV